MCARRFLETPMKVESPSVCGGHVLNLKDRLRMGQNQRDVGGRKVLRQSAFVSRKDGMAVSDTGPPTRARWASGFLKKRVKIGE